jgi:hypothetical protein
MVGDFLHNVHSALDHLMAALVATEGHAVTSQTQFPIFTERSRFEAKAAPRCEARAPKGTR